MKTMTAIAIGLASLPAGAFVQVDKAQSAQGANWTPLRVERCDADYLEPCFDDVFGGSVAIDPEPRPQSLVPWLADAQHVNRVCEYPSFSSERLEDVVAEVQALTGLETRCSEGLLEALRRGGRSNFWGGGGMGRTRPCDALNELAHDRFHARWTLRDGKITLISDSEFAREAQRSDADPRNQALADRRARVRVQWSQPVLHEFEFRADHGEAGRRRLVLSGRLFFVEDSGKEVPLTWPLSVAVVIARRADEKPDWSAGVDRDNTCLWWTSGQNGVFNVHLEPNQIERVPGATRAFQVGVCLPDFEPGGTWRRTARAIPQSILAMQIGGPLVLDNDLAAINACAANDWRNYDPAAYVRALNRLRKLGKQRALALLRQYAELVPSEGFASGPTREGNLDFGNSANVFWIVRLLFDFDRAAFAEISGEVRMATGFDRAQAVNGFCMATGMVSGSPYRAQSYPGGQYPFVVAEGLPFFAPEWREGRTGPDSSPMDAIDWAEAHGTVRTEDLRPTDDPIGLVESRLGQLGPLPEGTDSAWQVWRMLATLIDEVPRCPDNGWIQKFGNPSAFVEIGSQGAPFDLTHLKQAIAARGGVHWDESSQRYVLGPRER